MFLKTDTGILANFIAGSFGKIVGVFGPIIIVPLMFRTWGQGLYGEWLILTAIPAYIMLTPDLGLSSAIVNEIAFLIAQDRKQLALDLYSTSTVILLSTGVVFIIFGIYVSQFMDWRHLGVNKMNNEEITRIMIWCCTQIFIAQQVFLLSGLYKAVRKNPRYAFMQTIYSSVSLSISFFLLTNHVSPSFYAASLAGTQAIFWAVLLIDTRRIAPLFTLETKSITLRLIKPYIIPGLGHAGMPFIHAVQNQGVLLILGAVLGAPSVSVFQTLRVISNGIKSLLGVISSAIIAELPRLLGDGNILLIQRLLVRNTQIALVISMSVFIVFFVSGEFIYSEWIGNAINFSNKLLLLLIISIFPFSIGSSFNLILLSSNLIHLTVVPLIIMTCFSIGMVALSSIYFGFVGVGLSILFWEITTAVLLVYMASRKTQLNGYAFFVEIFNIKSLMCDCRQLLKKLMSPLMRR